MSEILSSLEHDFARHADADRDAEIKHLRELAAAGRGRVEITPGSLILGLVQIALGLALACYTFSESASLTTAKTIGGYLGGALFVTIGAWMIVLSRQPLFALTEEGVEVRGTLLPWTTIDDYEIHTTGYAFLTVSTTIMLHHVQDHEPPKPAVFRVVGKHRNRKTGLWQTVFLMLPKARRLSATKLSDAIGRFLAGAHARQALSEYGDDARR